MASPYVWSGAYLSTQTNKKHGHFLDAGLRAWASSTLTAAHATLHREPHVLEDNLLFDHHSNPLNQRSVELRTQFESHNMTAWQRGVRCEHELGRARGINNEPRDRPGRNPTCRACGRGCGRALWRVSRRRRVAGRHTPGRTSPVE